MFDYFKDLFTSEKEKDKEFLENFSNILGGLSDEEISDILIATTRIRLVIEDKNDLRGILLEPSNIDATTTSVLMNDLVTLNNYFRNNNLFKLELGCAIWIITITNSNKPTLRTLIRKIWNEISRGNSYIDQAYERLKESYGTSTFVDDDRIQDETGLIPIGFEPSTSDDNVITKKYLVNIARFNNARNLIFYVINQKIINYDKLKNIVNYTLIPIVNILKKDNPPGYYYFRFAFHNANEEMHHMLNICNNDLNMFIENMKKYTGIISISKIGNLESAYGFLFAVINYVVSLYGIQAKDLYQDLQLLSLDWHNTFYRDIKEEDNHILLYENVSLFDAINCKSQYLI